MKFMSSIFLIVVVSAFFIWWKNSQQNQLETEKNKLTVENVKLKDELGEIKNSPGWLLKTAKESYKKEDYRNAKEKLLILIYKYRNSREFAEAKSLLNTIDAKLNPRFVDASISEDNGEFAENNSTGLLKMYSNLDATANSTLFQDESSPRYKNENGIFLYFEKENDGDVKNIRLRIQLVSSQPFPLNNYQFNIDNQLYSYVPAKVEQDRDRKTNWEWSDDPLNRELYNLIVKIIYSNNTVINFNSGGKVKKRVVTHSEKEAFKNVFSAYKELGGSLNY